MFWFESNNRFITSGHHPEGGEGGHHYPHGIGGNYNNFDVKQHIGGSHGTIFIANRNKRGMNLFSDMLNDGIEEAHANAADNSKEKSKGGE